MSDLSANISALRAERGLSRAALAELLGVTADKIKHVETGHQRADHELLFALATKLNVDINALLGVASAGQILPNDRDRQIFPSDSDFVSIPRLSVQASAGSGALVDDENHSGSYAFNRKWLERRRLKPDNLSVIAVRGDSMEPMLTDGDLILVDRAQRQIADGLTYVLRVDDDLMVKMMQHLKHGVIALISANDFYPPREINLNTEGDQVEIIGRVVASMQEW